VKIMGGMGFGRWRGKVRRRRLPGYQFKGFGAECYCGLVLPES
jgi:hypothetical protein